MIIVYISLEFFHFTHLFEIESGDTVKLVIDAGFLTPDSNVGREGVYGIGRVLRRRRDGFSVGTL